MLEFRKKLMVQLQENAPTDGGTDSPNFKGPSRIPPRI